jgi:hypothetical protein
LRFVRLDSMEEVEALLAEWKLDSGAFEVPWKNDCPLSAIRTLTNKMSVVAAPPRYDGLVLSLFSILSGMF